MHQARWVSTYLVILCWLVPLTCLLPSLFEVYGKVLVKNWNILRLVVMFINGNSLVVQVVLKDYTQTCTIVALEGEGQFFCTSRQNWQIAYRLSYRYIVIFRSFQRSQTSPFLGFCLPSTSGHRRFQPCDLPQDQSSKSSRERKGQVQENTIAETDGHVHPDDLSCLRGLARRLPPLCHCRHCPWHLLSSKSS